MGCDSDSGDKTLFGFEVFFVCVCFFLRKLNQFDD